MDKLLTIVVPSYNVESTLRRTVESLLVPNQALRLLLDILIVNDGSKDGTFALARQLEAENPGIVRVWGKENGGHGSALNVGIDHGCGKYLKIVDGDDWLETDALEQYLQVLSVTDADVVATDYYRFFMSDGVKRAVKSSDLPYDKLLQFSEVWSDYTFFMLSLSVKTALLKQQRRRIDEHCYYVDVEFDTLVALVVETVLYLDIKLYVYRLQNAGQSVSIEGWMKHYPEHERVTFRLVEWYQTALDNTTQKSKVSYMENRVINLAWDHYKIGLDFPSKERKLYLQHLRDFDAEIEGKGKAIYDLTAKHPVTRIIRRTNFSYNVYSCLGMLKKLKAHLKRIKGN